MCLRGRGSGHCDLGGRESIAAVSGLATFLPGNASVSPEQSSANLPYRCSADQRCRVLFMSASILRRRRFYRVPLVPPQLDFGLTACCVPSQSTCAATPQRRRSRRPPKTPATAPPTASRPCRTSRKTRRATWSYNWRGAGRPPPPRPVAAVRRRRRALHRPTPCDSGLYRNSGETPDTHRAATCRPGPARGRQCWRDTDERLVLCAAAQLISR